NAGLYPATLPLQGGGPDGDELPSSPLHTPHAGLCVRRDGASPRRVSDGSGHGIPVLQLWGCDGASLVFEFRIDATAGAARAGTLTLPHGVVETPAFMPVGTQGTVRALSPLDLANIGSGIVLANTYHLHVRPGEETVAKLGGLHR